MEIEEKHGHILKTAVLLFFALYFVIGLFCYDDYGCGPDEGMERQTSLVNYKYVIEKLGLPVSEENRTWMEYLPDLKEYRDRYYGTALHFPLVLIEAAFHFTLTSRQFYMMRHFYTFLNFFAGMIFFYDLLRKRFGSGWGLIGTIAFVATPRFFAESFYNNKDLIFVAWYIISIWFSLRWVEKKDFRSAAECGIILALTCNTRFNAIVFFPMLAAVWLYDFIFRKERGKKAWLSLLLLLSVATAVFIAVTPNFWESPLTVLRETFEFNRQHPNHTADGNLFFGKIVDAAKTRSFVPVWIFLTTPLIYLLLSAFGCICFAADLVRYRLQAYTDRRRMTNLFLFCIGFLPVAAIILMHVFIYNSWRHCYFCYPTILYFAVLGASRIAGQKRREFRWGVVTLFLIAILGNGIWIIRNHPHEYAYFSPVVRKYSSLFSGDYWGISSRELIGYIVDSDPGKHIKINHLYSPTGSINRGLLDRSDRHRLELTYDESRDVDYYIVIRDDKPSTDIGKEKYEPVYNMVVDGDTIATVWKKK